MNETPSHPKRATWFSAVIPGILVAATGVGAGDLMTASLGGSVMGYAVLWAAVAGALFKWFLNEGLARWQMATGTTLLEGWVTRLGSWIQWLFLIYLALWTVFTGGALVTACGVAGTGLLMIGDDPATSKIVWGVLHSMLGLGLVLWGGFKLFERLMTFFIAVMFITVLLTAILMRPDWAAVGKGIVIPTLDLSDGGKNLGWVLGILGGVGGTVTVMCYGYWIREGGREGASGVRACRLDLALGYLMTAAFGIALVIIATPLKIEKGALMALDMAGQLEGHLGTTGKWVFLFGFWGAVFSSLLGVWQGIPYLVADFVTLRRGVSAEERKTLDFKKTRPYYAYLFALAFFSLPVLWLEAQRAALIYGILGSLFMPLLALTLLIMNNKTAWVGKRYRNGWITNVVLVVTLLFFAFATVFSAKTNITKLLNRGNAPTLQSAEDTPRVSPDANRP